MQSHKTALVLASSLRVSDPGFLQPSGVHATADRLDDTVEALRFWLAQRHFDALIFVDNSGEELGPLQRRLPAAPGREIEFLRFEASTQVREKGRSFGELEIMQHARDNSALLAEYSHFAKVNARLQVGNLDVLMRSWPETYDAVGRLSHNLTWLTSTFLAFQTAFYFDRILPYSMAHADDPAGAYIEHVYAQALLREIAEGAQWFPFAVEPNVIGRRGWDGRRYARRPLGRWLVNLVTKGYHRAYDHTTHNGHPSKRRTE